MKRRTSLLLLMLAISLAFAAWQWLRPYEWRADPAARFRVTHASVERDHSYLWLKLRLENTGKDHHDFGKPMTLLLADGSKAEPAETSLEGDAENPIMALHLRFWLEDDDFSGPIQLHINDGLLDIRSGHGIPALGNGETRHFNTCNW